MQDPRVEGILATAVLALAHGARGARIDAAAVESFRRRFADRIRIAVEDPAWRVRWREEQVYVKSFAAAVGKRAARLAGEEGRDVIREQDLELALVKMRGQLPVAGRWCPG